MSLPIATPLQFLTLSQLVVGERAGHELRAMLSKEGVRKTGPAFYQLMSRLEDAKLVKGRYKNTTIDEQIVRERWYKITRKGDKAVMEYCYFADRHAWGPD